MTAKQKKTTNQKKTTAAHPVGVNRQTLGS